MSENFYKNLFIDKSIADKLNFNPYYPIIESGISNPVLIKGENFIDLASNDYLGLTNNEDVKNCIIKSLRKYGASMCGTPIATGYVDIFKKAEMKLSNFLGLEDSIIFPSCFQANVSLFPSIINSKDLIIFDQYVHASMIQSIRTTDCKIKPFKHNNLEHLENLLKRSTGFREVFVVTESVFSTEGVIAPFKEIVDLCNKFNAIPVIDDSHGIGVIGSTGKGILEFCQISNYSGIYTASLGKGIANAGGIISGKNALIDFLRYSCSGLIYSTALPPYIFSGIIKVLEIIEKDYDSLSKKMWANKNFIAEKLTKKGFGIYEGKAPIIAIIGGSLENTIWLAREFYYRHILTTPFVPPSVPPEKGIVRLIAGSNLSSDSLDKIQLAIYEIGKLLSLK